jgi:hypothetical protein
MVIPSAQPGTHSARDCATHQNARANPF